MLWLVPTLWGCNGDPAPPGVGTTEDTPTTVADSGDTGDPADTGELPEVWPDDPYLMAFHTCDPDQDACGDPMSHQVHVAGSDDGFHWTELAEVDPFPSSVPDLIVRDSVLYVYGLPQLRRFDLRTWDVQPLLALEILDQDGEEVFHADPSMVLGDDGLFVMFFLEGLQGEDPSGCPGDDYPCTKRILSATEVAGSDGHEFRVDDGARLEVPVEDTSGRVSDPDLVEGPEGWRMLLSRGQNVQVYGADTLRGTYAAVSELELNRGSGGVPAGQYIAESDLWWLYVTSHVGEDLSEIRFAELDTLDEKMDDDLLEAVAITPEGYQGVLQVASPGIWARP